MGRHHLSPRTHPSLRSTTAKQRSAGGGGRFCSSRDKSTAASHPSTRTLGPDSAHLENRTVPCSKGLWLTARQLCLISSSSGRSMLSPREERSGTQEWDPQGLGAVTARAAPSPERRGGSGGRGKGGLQAQCLNPAGLSNRFAGPAERMRTRWRFRGGPCSSSCALCPEAPREPPFKAMVVPTPSGLERLVHSLRTRLRQGRPEAWEMSRLQSLTEIAEPQGLFHS